MYESKGLGQEQIILSSGAGWFVFSTTERTCLEDYKNNFSLWKVGIAAIPRGGWDSGVYN